MADGEHSNSLQKSAPPPASTRSGSTRRFSTSKPQASTAVCWLCATATSSTKNISGVPTAKPTPTCIPSEKCSPAHAAASCAGEHFSDGIHVGVGFAVGTPEIFFVDEVAVAHNQQTAVLA